MDKLITNLIKHELTLEEEVQAELDARFAELDINLVLANPVGELTDFSTRIMEEVFVKFSRRFVKAGLDFAEAVDKSKVKVELTDVNNG